MIFLKWQNLGNYAQTLGIKCHYLWNYNKKTHAHRLFWGDIATLTDDAIIIISN